MTDSKAELSLAWIADQLSLPVPDDVTAGLFDPVPHLIYQSLNGSEAQAAMHQALSALLRKDQEKSGAHRIDAWRKGWGEIRDQFVERGDDYIDLCPQYFKYDKVRMLGGYARVEPSVFEFAFCHAVKAILYSNFLKEEDQIIDLGAGTGSNVLLLLSLLHRARIVGADWAEASVDLIDTLGDKFKGRARGVLLDMLTGNGFDSLKAEPGCVFLSVHAFEQLGEKFELILRHMLEAGPRLCIQIEPIGENYDRDRLSGVTGELYHRKRGYLQGYKTRLKELNDNGTIEILLDKHLPVGNLFHDPYSILVWRPVLTEGAGGDA